MTGTPYLAASAQAGSGATTLAASVGTTTAVGDTIAVWVTSNASTSNISGVTDSQGNTYAAQGAAADGTNINGQWFVAGPANNPAGPKKLTAGTDTITGQYSGTGGSKTVEAIGCSGLAGTADQISGPETGTGTSISYPTPATTTGNDLVLAGEVNNNAGGTPVTWGGSFAAPVFTDTESSGATHSNVAAVVPSSPQAITTTATLPSSGNWASATIALAPLNTGSSQARVGATIPNLALSVANACYDAGLTQAAADSQFCGFVQRGIGPQKNHLAVTKKFWSNVNDYSLNKNDLANYVSFGTKIIFALTPPFTGGTAADQAALANFLAGLIALGFTATTAVIVLWQEPENGNHFGNGTGGSGTGPAGYGQQMAFFGPVVNASGLPLAQDVGMGAGDSTAQNYLNAGYAAAGVQFQAQYADFYFGAFKNGIRLDNVAAIADAHGVPFGLGEYGCHVTDNYQAYFNYITGFFQARLAAVPPKPISDLEYYQGQCSATGAGDLTSPILSSTDPRIPFFQAQFDTLTSIPAPNTITVTSPGNQTGTAGTPIAPLTITATDSEPGQTLTFTAAGLPAGLSISAGGVITGTPTTQGTYSVTVTAADGTGASGSTGFSWVISPVVTNTVTVTNPGAQSTQLGAVVSKALTATDSNAAITTFTWGAGGLPPGLSISASSGTISGIPTAVGAFTVTVTAADSTGSSGSATFTWQITNPNVLPHGQFTTLPPVSPSPVAGLGAAQQLSYEITLGLTAGAGSTQPFTAITVQFYDFDALPALQSPVATVTYRCPMGTFNDPNGPAVIYGRGPMRGAFMRIRANNTDSVDGTLAFLKVVGTAREVERDDWRWDCGGNAPVIPGYTNANAATASLVMGGISGAVLAANASTKVLCSMFAGKVWLRAHYAAGGASSVQVSVAPQPPALFSSQSVFNESMTGGSELTAEIAVPRGPCLLTLTNNDGATSATAVFAELIAIET
jgi:hypothetical protein